MRAFAIAVLLGLGLIFVASTTASAATITEPSGKTIEVGVDDQGYAAATTVKAGGFEPYENVFLEMCNGRPANASDWSPTLDCDLGSSPAAAVADENGVATFAADDPNHALFPFVGPGPQELFQCFASGKVGPARTGMESYTNCQLRISTSNNEATDDQAFVTLALPAAAKTGWRSPEFPKAGAAAGQQPAGSGQASSGAARSTDGNAATSSKESSSTASAPSGSGSSSDDFPVLPVVLSIVVVAGGAVTVLVVHKRRSGRVAA